eukprot:763024-Hanusia_phi.AAC.2
MTSSIIDNHLNNLNTSLDSLIELLGNPEWKFLQYIDRIFYINLKSRPDRNEHALRQLRLLDPTLEKVERIEGVVYENDKMDKSLKGAIGCSKAHITAAEIMQD